MSAVKNIGTFSGKRLLTLLLSDQNQIIRNLNTSVCCYSLNQHRVKEFCKQTKPNLSVQSVNSVPFLQTTTSDIKLIRHYSSENNPHERHDNNDNDRENEERRYRRHDRVLPPFSNEPIIEFPSFTKSLKNFLCLFFILKCYLDREFSWSEFVKGSKQALQLVSKKLSDCDLASLENLVEGNTLDILRRNVGCMSYSQRQEIAVDKDDIILSFPYDVQFITEQIQQNGVQCKKYSVEIMMVYHVLNGLKELSDKDIDLPWKIMPQYKKKLSICNYRFVKEFTTGAANNWTINFINHNMLIDIENERNDNTDE